MNTKSKSGIAGCLPGTGFRIRIRDCRRWAKHRRNPSPEGWQQQVSTKDRPPGVGRNLQGRARPSTTRWSCASPTKSTACPARRATKKPSIRSTRCSEFTAKYEHDQEMTRASLDESSTTRRTEAVKAEWRAMRADFETSHVGLKLLDSYGDCARIVTANHTGTCEKFDALGNKVEVGNPEPLRVLLTFEMPSSPTTRATPITSAVTACRQQTSRNAWEVSPRRTRTPVTVCSTQSLTENRRRRSRASRSRLEPASRTSPPNTSTRSASK